MMTQYQLKSARVLLCLTPAALAKQLGRSINTVRNWERGAINITKSSELAIKFLLTEAGLYAHFRMVYMRRDKLYDVNISTSDDVMVSARQHLIHDALAFKYDR
jgi:transcriptional regulator with XRE-family HTH domain